MPNYNLMFYYSIEEKEYVDGIVRQFLSKHLSRLLLPGDSPMAPGVLAMNLPLALSGPGLVAGLLMGELLTLSAVSPLASGAGE